MERMEGKLKLCRIFISENDTFEGNPLYKMIVEACRQQGLAGATVIRGIYGYGHSGVIHSSKSFVLSEGLPVIVEIVDTDERIDEIMPVIENMMTGGMITYEAANVILFKER